MSRLINKIKSHLQLQLIYVQIIILIAISAFYAAASHTAEYFINQYDKQNNLSEQESELETIRFLFWVEQENLSIYDTDAFDKWVSEHPYIYLRLYYANTLFYDSISGTVQTPLAEGTMSTGFQGEKYHAIYFKEGMGFVLIYSFPNDRLQNRINIILLLISFALYLILISVIIRKKLNYLITIRKDLEILSENDLHHSVTVCGNDELAEIATGIDSLRQSVLVKMEKEKKAYHANQELITSLSHDVRTPLTSLIGYLELLRTTPSEQQDKYREYQENAKSKAYRLKELTDELFEYFLVNSNASEIPMEMVNANELVAQMVEEILLDLDADGVSVIREVSDITCQLYLNIDMVRRLFENIFSNLHKYADFQKPVYVKYCIDNQELMLVFRNTKKPESKHSSSKIGLKSCRMIMEQHHGEMSIHDGEESFEIRLRFPAVNIRAEITERTNILH